MRAERRGQPAHQDRGASRRAGEERAGIAEVALAVAVAVDLRRVRHARAVVLGVRYPVAVLVARRRIVRRARVDEPHRSDVVGVNRCTPAVEVRTVVHRRVLEHGVRLVVVLRGVADADRVAELVRRDLGDVRLVPERAGAEAVVERDVALGDAIEGRAVHHVRLGRRAEPAEREHAGTADGVRDLVEGVVEDELRDAVAP